MSIDRRDFLKTGRAAVVAGLVAGRPGEPAAPEAAADQGPFAAPPINEVRIGYVGVGQQGGGHVQNLLKIPGCRITVVCDIRPDRTAWAAKQITAAGQPPPVEYTRG